MQKIVICPTQASASVSSAETLKNALAEYANDYFDGFDIETNAANETLVHCKVGNVNALTFVYNSSSNPKELIRAQNNIVKWTSNALCIYNLYVMQNAIVLEYGYIDYYFEPYSEGHVAAILGKRSDGKTALVYASHHSIGDLEFDMSTWGNDGYSVISIDRKTGASTIGEMPIFGGAQFSNAFGFNPVADDGVPVINVYIFDKTGFDYSYNRDYDETYSAYIYKPFEYSLNNETMTGFLSNLYAIKGT